MIRSFLRRLLAPRRYDTTRDPDCPDCGRTMRMSPVLISSDSPPYLSGKCACGRRLDLWPDGRVVR